LPIFHKILDVDAVGSPSFWIVDVGEPLGLRGHVGQALELGGRQEQAAGCGDERFRLALFFTAFSVVHDTFILVQIKYIINTRPGSKTKSETMPGDGTG